MANKTIHSEGRKYIYRVIKFCDEEKERGQLIVPINNTNTRASLATQVSERTISQIRKKGHMADDAGTELGTPSKKRKPSPKKFP
ncbi:hypothetical protein ANN_18700 [Periplaneta americana]|uniref:Transposase n=1 Tax=Periplaneta americana TaxID=6978 RepID=A0ABQ8SPY5_PERAM|nr:hypothetical protein ANN_18700 [Periplaneta americana]